MVGGFLQVAVSEAPPEDSPTAHDCVAGAPDTALRLHGTDIQQLLSRFLR